MVQVPSQPVAGPKDADDAEPDLEQATTVAALRHDLAAAQASDPVLAEVIGFLRGGRHVELHGWPHGRDAQRLRGRPHLATRWLRMGYSCVERLFCRSCLPDFTRAVRGYVGLQRG